MFTVRLIFTQGFSDSCYIVNIETKLINITEEKLSKRRKHSQKHIQNHITITALANEDTLLPTHVADTNVSQFCRNICCGHKFCVRDTKNVFDFVQKHFVSATNVSEFAQHKNTTFILCPARMRTQKHYEQQCVRNNGSSFARAFTKSSVPRFDWI